VTAEEQQTAKKQLGKSKDKMSGDEESKFQAIPNIAAKPRGNQTQSKQHK
jgi:hypothetical protein